MEIDLMIRKYLYLRNIAKDLYKCHLEIAKRIYDCKVIEFHTYGDEDEFPQNWYKRIGFKKDEELIIMSANINEILNKI